jgi:DNA-binding SARP family transcriptional activator/tetratricopeptide (TPR) repeat protein
MAGAATQRRTLALLAMLAVAGDAGLSREKLVGVLWPESPAERARHSLTQAMYAARRALNDDALFVASAGHVRLDADRLTSDVRRFEAALDAGHLEEAVALHDGPFLDGFFLSGTPDFEQWSSAQRERLQLRAASALEELATSAEESGDATLAVQWRRRLSALLPLDTASTVKLMTALAGVGDRAGAIQQARVHATMLREELELEPDSEVEALAARLRSSSTWSDAPNTPIEERDDSLATSENPVARAPSAIVGRYDDVTVHPRDDMAIQPRELTIPLWVRWTVISLVVFVLVGTGVLIGRARDSTPEVRPLAVHQSVVVAPFRVAGAAPSLGYLRDGMVELLSTRLADDSSARSVDAGAVLGAWRAAALSPQMDVPRDTVVKLASRLGADRVVVGSVVGTPARMVLSATLMALPSGAVTGSASVSGPGDSLYTLIDKLAAKLLLSEAGQDDELSHYVSSSLPALRSFLAGQSAFRRGDYASAIRSYRLALRRDSSFALAALYEALSADRIGLEQPLRVGVALAWPSRDELSELDQARLSALAGPRYPALSTVAEHDAARELLARLTTSPDSVIPLAVEPPPLAEWQSAVSRGDSAALGRLRATMPRWTSAALRALAMRSQIEQISLDDGARALELLDVRGGPTADRIDITLGAHSLALDRGDRDRALEATAQLHRLQPGSHAWLRLRVLDGLYGDGDTAVASAAARTLVESSGAAPLDAASTSETWLADECVLAQWRLSRGDTSRVAGVIARLRGSDLRGTAAPVTATPAACAALLDASLAVHTHKGDARARVQHLDSLVFTPQAAGDAHSYARIAIARMFERLGASSQALNALRTHRTSGGWPRYLSASARYERALAEQPGAH